MELSFYWALCISQFFDVKRKDFWEMFIHHVTTIALMGFSWTCNLTRVGTLVLVIHDCADIFLEVIIYVLPGFWMYNCENLENLRVGFWIFRVFYTLPSCGIHWTCNLTLVLVIQDCVNIFLDVIFYILAGFWV